MSAISAWEKALKLKPDDESVLQELAFVYNRLNRNNDAIRIYSKLAQMEPDSAKYHNLLGFAYFNSGRFKEALKEFDKVLAINKNYPGAMDGKRLSRNALDRGRG